MNTTHIFALLLLVFQLTGTPPAQKPPDEAAIEGMVVRTGDGEALGRAQLTLTRVKPPAELAAPPPPDPVEYRPEFPPIPPITTAADGRFRFSKLAPGSYRLSVVCNGYVSADYGQKSFGGQGAIITLTAGKVLKDVLFRLQTAALVTGHIRDSEGYPIPGVTLTLAKVSYDSSGSREINGIAGVSTDDRGEYRLFFVTPGRYYLSVSVSNLENTIGNMVQDLAFPRFYYPGTMEFSRATTIDVAPGAEMSAMDMVISKPTTYKIKGTVVDSGGGNLPRNVALTLTPRSENDDVRNGGSYGGQGSITNKDGTFEISNVVPGSYWLMASARPDFSAPLPADVVAGVRTASDLFGAAFSIAPTAEIPVDVGASDRTGVSVTLAPGIRVPLRISLEGKELASLSDFEKIRISLWPKLGNRFVRQPGPVTADGVGAVENVGSWEYRVRMDGIPDIYIKEATLDNNDMLNAYGRFSDDSHVLRVVLGDKPGRVQGMLTDAASKPVAGVQVILIPEKFRHRNELYQTVDTDEDGRFVFRSIPPGDYRVFSWEALDPFEYFDPAVLAKYEHLGKLVKVSESSTETVDVRIIPALQP